MNREERRRKGIKGKEPVINIKVSDIEKMKSDAVKEASNLAFKLMLSIPVMVLHDNYGKLNRLNVDGKTREERFAEMVLDLYNSFEKGDVTLDDLMQCLKDETGMTFEKI